MQKMNGWQSGLMALIITTSLSMATAAMDESSPEAPLAEAGAVVDAAEDISAVMKTPHQVVEETTLQIMGIITEAKGYFAQDPARFYREIDTVMNELVDFKGFSRGVMGKYAGKKRYQSLATDEERELFKAQVTRFSETFRAGLVQTYAKGLIAFNGNRIDVLPPKEEVQNGSSVTVVQHIYGQGDKPFVVHYKMRQDKAGSWKLRNVTIEAINLGRVYQSQFYSAVKQHEGDIDKVIDGWSVGPSS